MHAVLLDHAPLLERLFSLEVAEGPNPITRVEGRLPDWLRGTYYLNGPARFERGGLRYRHWLDGDGLVSALTFAADGVECRHRFVRGRKLEAEQQAGRFLFRAFGTAFAGDRLVRGMALESPVNVSAYPAFGTLLAFGEQGLPWELDPRTLETWGEYDFGRRLNPVSPFSAHPAIDHRTGELFNFGVSFSAARPQLHFYRFDREGHLLSRSRLPLDYPCSLHDFALSPRYAVFYLSPYVLDIETLTQRGGSVLEALDWQSERGSRLVVVDRASGKLVSETPIGAAYSLHQINACERQGLLAVDVVELDRPIYDQYLLPDLFDEARGARCVRYEIDPVRGELLGEHELAYRHMCDFPSIDPRRAGLPYDDFWVLGISQSEREGRKFFDELVHLDWRRPEPAGVFRAPRGSYLGGEPVFAPRPGHPGEGVVICQRFDAETRQSAFLVFDAHDVAAGPLATLEMANPVPLGFHTSFAPDDG